MNEGSMDPNLNSTYIALIPKICNLFYVTEFRPISLCNVIYKLVSKVLVNRLKPYMDLIISSPQSAFIPDMIITDNIIVIVTPQISLN